MIVVVVAAVDDNVALDADLFAFVSQRDNFVDDQFEMMNTRVYTIFLKNHNTILLNLLLMQKMYTENS